MVILKEKAAYPAGDKRSFTVMFESITAKPTLTSFEWISHTYIYIYVYT